MAFSNPFAFITKQIRHEYVSFVEPFLGGCRLFSTPPAFSATSANVPAFIVNKSAFLGCCFSCFMGFFL